MQKSSARVLSQSTTAPIQHSDSAFGAFLGGAFYASLCIVVLLEQADHILLLVELCDFARRLAVLVLQLLIRPPTMPQCTCQYHCHAFFACEHEQPRYST